MVTGMPAAEGLKVMEHWALKIQSNLLEQNRKDGDRTRQGRFYFAMYGAGIWRSAETANKRCQGRRSQENINDTGTRT